MNLKKLMTAALAFTALTLPARAALPRPDPAVAEQADPHGGLFGEERLLASLQSGGFLEHPESCAGAVLAFVDAHAAGAPQSDDRTQLVVCWRGPVTFARPRV